MKKYLLVLFIIFCFSVSALADWYIPLNQVPAIVLATARKAQPTAEVWAVEMEHFNVYEVKMSNMMKLYIDKSGNLLGQEFDD